MGKDDLPLNPWVQLTLKSWGISENSNAPLVSAQLMTEGEIDYQIEALKTDLDAVGRSAKTALRKAQDNTKELVSKHINQPL